MKITNLSPQAITEIKQFLVEQQEELETRFKTPLYQVMDMSPEITTHRVFDVLQAELDILREDLIQEEVSDYENKSIKFDERREMSKE